ncbi:hypothetical protein OF83DRAFT_336807 [Amylostereum chailletii]|nr:hypothetical protein OF83DRAFT_336807 [Amylostereum chailletii]
MTSNSSSFSRTIALLALLSAPQVYALRRTGRGSRLARGAIAGIVVAIIVGFVVLALIFICCCARRRRNQQGVAGVSPSGRLGLPFFGSKPFRPPQNAPPPPPVDPRFDQGYSPAYPHNGTTGAGAGAGIGGDDGRYYSVPSFGAPAHICQ